MPQLSFSAAVYAGSDEDTRAGATAINSANDIITHAYYALSISFFRDDDEMLPGLTFG